MKNLSCKKMLWDFVILACSVILIYIFTSIYFIKNFSLGTIINDVDVSGLSIEEAGNKLEEKARNYKLKIRGRGDIQEVILASDINLEFNFTSKIISIKKEQKPILWIIGLLKKSRYINTEIFSYDDNLLKKKILDLDYFNKDKIVIPKNASFKFEEGTYKIEDEILGNKLNERIVEEYIEKAIKSGSQFLDLEKLRCYEEPVYIAKSHEIFRVKKILDKYISSKIIYTFGEEEEVLDCFTINKWIYVDEKLNVNLDEKEISKYINYLSEKCNTVGKVRTFKTSSGFTVTIEGGYYGWKINSLAEQKLLIEDIKSGKEVVREPMYSQRGANHGELDIGENYIEISIDKQHLWYYKEGKLVVDSDVVTGNVNRGFSTTTGVYMLTYKQKNTTLKGENYSATVKYWMPFNGNIGMHDASWRHSFGGSIFKNQGSHGCVNLPEHIAKILFENIEEGTPVICY